MCNIYCPLLLHLYFIIFLFWGLGDQEKVSIASPKWGRGGGWAGDPFTQPRSMFCPHLTPHSPPVMHLTQWPSPGGNPGLMQPCMGTVTYCVAFDGSF